MPSVPSSFQTALPLEPETLDEPEAPRTTMLFSTLPARDRLRSCVTSLLSAQVALQTIDTPDQCLTPF